MNYQPSPQSAQEEQNEILETASYARELGQQPQQQMSEPVSSENQSPRLAQEEPKAEAPKEISSENQSPKLAQEDQKTEATREVSSDNQ